MTSEQSPGYQPPKSAGAVTSRREVDLLVRIAFIRPALRKRHETVVLWNIRVQNYLKQRVIPQARPSQTRVEQDEVSQARANSELRERLAWGHPERQRLRTSTRREV